MIIPGTAHHVTQRSNYGRVVFEDEADFLMYCKLVKSYAFEYSIDILAYCLMSNHVHFVVVPRYEEGLSDFFKIVSMCYSWYFNKKLGVKGHLWQVRFYSCVLNDVHLYRAIRYVENNPVRAKMVSVADKYFWSSAQDHLALRRHMPVPVRLGGRGIVDKNEWGKYLTENDPAGCDGIRIATKKGKLLKFLV
jgi:putative transposase